MKLVRFENEKKYIKDFLSLGRELYGENCVQDDAMTKQVLMKQHPLSKYFSSFNFLVYREAKPVGRFVITFYDNDPAAYIGFYECEDNDETAKYLFDSAAEFAGENGRESLVGPVDCSFWIKYRLKTNMFDKPPYTGEPYNLEYYKKQFSDNGFETAEHYTSNVYDSIGKDYVNEKFEERFRLFSSQGIEINSLDICEFEKRITEVYYLLTDLYRDFPVFREIELDDFLEMFSSFKKAVDPRMVKLAFSDGKMVGFFISVPDYGNLANNLNPAKLLKIMQIKKSPKRYIMLYMGVDPKFRGLGKAMAYSVLRELKSRGASGVGALTRDGKVTQNYAEDLIGDRYEYVLLRRKI